MKSFKSNIALGLVNVIIFNSAAFAATGNTTALLLNDVKTLQSGIDSGAVKSTDAIDRFAQSIQNQNISIDDVNAFVQTQMSAEQFQTFQSNVNSSLRGIDESTLTPQETGEIVGQALSGVHTEGLYWSGCTNVWTGAALITAAVVTGIFAIIKSKSISSIQSDYQKKVTTRNNKYTTDVSNTTNSYNSQISNDQNWQTAFPNIIASDSVSIGNISEDEIKVSDQLEAYSNDIKDTTSGSYQNENDQGEINSLEGDLQADENAINNMRTQITNAQKQFATYTANPAQAPIDAANLAVARDQALADLANQLPVDIASLNSQETSAVGAAPANQALGEKLGIGAGIGFAVGTGLLVYGIKEGACN